MAGNPPDLTLRKLFGGAMECLLPAAFVDVSDLRQVPDHQEAFVSHERRVSIVIEVLTFETEISSPDEGDESAGGKGCGGSSARHFFDDLAAANGASSSACDFCGDMTDRIMPKLPSYCKSALAGRQTVAKFKGEGSPDVVRMYLVNVRLPNVGTDLLITVNVPYPDEGAAARSPAGAECFLLTAAPNEEESPAAAPAPASPASTPSWSPPAARTPAGSDTCASAGGSVSCAATDSAAQDGEEQAAEASLAGDGVEDVPEGVEKQAGAEGAAAGGGGGRQRGNLSSGGYAGVATLRSLLQSFAIVDWSLFG